jgi:hypothetical protein
MSTEAVTQEMIQNADEAYLSALTPKVIAGKELEPFSLMRQTVAMEIVGQEASQFFDAVVKIWLCTLDERTVIRQRRDRDQAGIDACAWAQKLGFSFINWKPLLDVYRVLQDEIRITTEVEQDGNHEPAPKELGEPLAF